MGKLTQSKLSIAMEALRKVLSSPQTCSQIAKEALERLAKRTKVEDPKSANQ